MTVIGGSDGPTAIFVADSMGWLNVAGLIIVVMMLLPNIVYALKNRGAENKCKNRLVNLLEQLGRYGCMLLMVFNIGIFEFGFASPAAFIVYCAGNILLLSAYCAFWLVYYKKRCAFTALMLAILPTLIFLLGGITLRHWLLVCFAVLFGVFHIYITVVNTREV